MNAQLASVEARRQQVMKIAVAEGIVTDRQTDGICTQLLSEGWLELAAPISRRPHVTRAHAYLPTEKAMNEWNNV